MHLHGDVVLHAQSRVPHVVSHSDQSALQRGNINLLEQTCTIGC